MMVVIFEKSFKHLSIGEIAYQYCFFKCSRSSIGSNKYVLFYEVKDSHKGDIHSMKNNQSLFSLELIDGADKVENMQNKDTISKNLLSKKRKHQFKNIHIYGADFYANYDG